MSLLIAAILMATVTPLGASDIDDYEPLTEEEAEAWLRSIDLEELIAFTIHADYVEHARPVINLPETAAVVTGDEVLIVPLGPMMVSVGRLEWVVWFDEVMFRAPYDPEPPAVPAWMWGAAGFVIGAAVVGVTIAVLR